MINMNFSIFTFVSTQIFISIFITLIAFLSKNNKFICKFGIYFALMPLLACLIRVIFPFEVSFTMILPSSYILATAYKLYDSLSFGSMRLSSLLISIWSIGSFGFTLLLIRDVFSIRKISNKPINQSHIYAALKKVKEERKYNFGVHIIVSDLISTPFIFGYFKPTVYIPDINYNERELYYIIDHELAHWRNKDLWIKLIVQIVCIIYWWNPTVYLLRDILSHSLEIKCDSFICQDLSIEEKSNYLKTIIHTLEGPSTRHLNRALITSNFADRKNNDEVKQRFKLVFDYDSSINKNKVLPIIFSGLIFLLTYGFVIQPEYLTQASDYINEGEEINIIDNNTSYIIYENGLYYLYFNNELLYELTSNQFKELGSNGIKIINKE